MKKMFLVLCAVAFSLPGCRYLYPVHIQIFTGDVKENYKVLGPVVASYADTLWSMNAPLIEDYYQIDMSLRRAAQERYGSEVQAVIKIKYSIKVQYRNTWCQNPAGCYRRLIYEAKGTAIQFLDEKQSDQ